DLDLLVARTAGRTHRPLLNNGDAREKLAELMAKRHPVYAEADIVFDALDESQDASALRVRSCLLSYLADHAETAP
ncbi:MAG TPA: shikimate kinase, partial [Rhodospirillum rubrum]|nr:shikimate kinase [Rhodospirillum rubrum]